LKIVEKFDMPFDIAKPINTDVMGIYTKRVADEDCPLIERLQTSGSILMP
jgi:hypothetical protein